MKIFLPGPPETEALAELLELRGAFIGGHTDYDARRVLRRVEHLTGIEFGIVWDYEDGSGLGGNSEMVFVDKAHRLREIPDEWRSFLYKLDEPSAKPFPVRSLFGLRVGNALKNSWKFGGSGEYNYYRRFGRAA